jgi:CheY-like chemotaxis protein
MVHALNPKNASVLIVEDNPDDAFLVARALEAFGIRHVFAVDTAEEAISFLKSQPCDVALVDYNLPRMNGLALLQRLLEAYPDLRIIIVTGARDDKIAASVMKNGAIDYVSKDEMLTSGIVRSLQQALRDEFTELDARRVAAIEAGSGGLAVARVEADWLTETLGGREANDASRAGAAADWLDLVQGFNRVITESIQTFPMPAERAEESLVRMLVSRGASPVEILRIYSASLRTMAAGQQALRMSPLLSLARVYARMLSEYQLNRSMDAARRTD